MAVDTEPTDRRVVHLDPTLVAAWMEGDRAHTEREFITECPYRQDTEPELFEAWRHGYRGVSVPSSGGAHRPVRAPVDAPTIPGIQIVAGQPPRHALRMSIPPTRPVPCLARAGLAVAVVAVLAVAVIMLAVI